MISETCTKIVYSIVSVKRERVTRCLQILQNVSHVRPPNVLSLVKEFKKTQVFCNPFEHPLQNQFV